MTSANPNLVLVLQFLTPLLVAVLALIQMLVAKAQAAKVETVAITAAGTADRAAKSAEVLKDLAEKTHILVNSQYGIALAEIAVQKERVAKLSGDPADFAEAMQARKNLDDHNQRQSRVDNLK